ncbi:serine hydrolase domain-containing protein [Parvularcula dongshanensis]|uniref:CubicO group peptidase (Beta-lactamase class C family) n=1 Tax=Parvularcula dongshanensis TaxID=1173995 RepID=A0A840I1G0_9PROT|nr:serine hydrolase [Parvularcula dongshanensis]MBB4657910.1 CubicO group peptidase (beta-lactamase class C family) [Parvularcula dongshanensis]
MRHLTAALAGFVFAALLLFGLWAFRPWSETSPAEVIWLSRAPDRTAPYRAMEETYPYLPIAASPTPYTFPRDVRALGASWDRDGERRTVEDYVAERAVTGLMVVHDGTVVFERYYRGETPGDRHTSWSVAKSMIATLIGRALMEGRIESLDDTAETYAADYEGTDYGATKIRDLLAMSSGIGFNENYEETGSDIRKLFLNTFIFQRDIDGEVRRYRRVKPAGGAFEYLSPNTAVLAAVLRGAYGGRSVASLAEEKVVAPLGMGAGSWLTDRHGRGAKVLGYCCLQLRLEDFAKLGQLYLQGGVVGTERVIPADWPAYVSTPPRPSHAPGGALPPSELGYGAHFWIAGEGSAYFMMGYNGQMVWIDPERRVVIAMTGADRTFDTSEFEAASLMRALASAAAGR